MRSYFSRQWRAATIIGLSLSIGSLCTGMLLLIFAYGEAMAVSENITWVQTGLQSGYIYELKFDIAVPTKLWAHHNKHRSENWEQSSDGGQTWLNGFNSYPFSEVADVDNPSIIYRAWGAAVQKTINGGRSWVYLTTSVGNDGFLLLDPVDKSVLALSDDIQRSTNGGQNWTTVNGSGIRELVGVSSESREFYVVHYCCPYNGVMKTTNLGLTWTEILTSSTRAINSFANAKSNPNVFYASIIDQDGIIKSVDGGKTWFPINNGLNHLTVNALAVDPTDENIVYAGTWEGGVYQTTDGGANWSTINDGLYHTYILSLAIDPLNPNIIYAGTQGEGVFKTVDPNALDTTPPSNPTSITSPSHVANQASADNTVEITWSNDAADNAGGSGLAGFATKWDTVSDTWPPTITITYSPTVTNETSPPLSPNASYFFHLRTCDKAGNCSDPIHRGPYVIQAETIADTIPPQNPTGLQSISHTPRQVSDNPVITVTWSNNAQDEGGSGLAGYSILWDTAETTLPDTAIDLPPTATSTRSEPLPDGNQHYFHLRTCDQAGNCSDPNHVGPFLIARPKSWTLLIYAVADNDLEPWLGDHPTSQSMLYRLKEATRAEHVEVVILYDGQDLNDTALYTVDAAGTFVKHSPEPVLGTGNREARMDDRTTLRDFIKWGMQTYQSDYYHLALLDHANGVRGIGIDQGTNNDGTEMLTPEEIRDALIQATKGTAQHINVLQFDGCSFGLLEDMSIAQGLADYVIASPNTGWAVFAYEQYRQAASQAETPRAYAEAVAQRYADAVAAKAYPYTISVFDMTHYGDAQDAVGTLGSHLNRIASTEEGRAKLKNLRTALQKYDSRGTLALEEDDSFVDLRHLTTVARNTLNDSGIKSASTDLLNKLDLFVIHQKGWHASGSFDAAGRTYTHTLDNSGGIAIYYPLHRSTAPTSPFQKYVTNRLFSLPTDWPWLTFVAEQATLSGNPSIGDEEMRIPLPLTAPPPPPPPSPDSEAFLPVILR